MKSTISATNPAENKSPEIILLFPPNQLRIISHTPPLGILYIASYLRNNGINVKVYDLEAEKKRLKDILREILNLSPKIIALSCNIANFENGIILARFFKENIKRTRILMGGPLPTSFPHFFLAFKEIDVIIMGEGELTILNFLKNNINTKGLYLRAEDGADLTVNYELIENSERLLNSGSIYIPDRIIFTGEPEIIKNVDDIPFPALDLVNLKRYHFSYSKKRPISAIITSRGCPFHCTFCFHGVFGYKWRPRSPENVVKEIEWQVNELGAKELCIWDDNFTLDIKRAEKICDLIIEKNLKFSWQCSNGIRSDRITEQLLTKMKKAGCWNIALAPESGDPEIVKRLKKGFTLEQVKKARSLLKRQNILTGMFFILGLPYENEQHRQNTLNFIKEVDPDYISVHNFTPFPSTEIVKEERLVLNLHHSYKSGVIDKATKKYFQKINFWFYTKPHHLVRIIKLGGLRTVIETAWQYFKTQLSPQDKSLKKVLKKHFGYSNTNISF